MLLYNAINFWVAEERKEDFLINSNIIEVKATLNSNHVHIINGIDQLLIIPNFNKYILSATKRPSCFLFKNSNIFYSGYAIEINITTI